nr:zinc-ribbon domain-containing protein [uncultured Acetobacterium sp.]
MITCPRCGKSNPDGTEFCLYCGNDLKKKADLATDRKNDLNAASKSSRTPETKGNRFIAIRNKLSSKLWNSKDLPKKDNK